MKKYPFVKQSNNKDCAVACLQMIMKYYHGYASESYLEELTKTNKNGTTAFHLIEGAKNLGFESKGLKLELEDLSKLVFPCVAHLTLNKTYNHYVVIYEIDFTKKLLVIGDPASGIIKKSFKEFEQVWNNIIITFIPYKSIPMLQHETKLKDLFILISKAINNLSKPIIITCIVSIIFSIISSFSFKIMLDELNDIKPQRLITVTFILFLYINLFKNLFTLLRNKLLIIVSHRLSWNITKDIFKKIISLPYSYYRNHTTGDLVSRINDLRIINEIVSQIVIISFVDLPLMFVSGIILLFINKILFLSAFIILILIFILQRLFTPFYKKQITLIQDKRADLNNNMIEKINGFETIKGLDINEETVQNFEKKFYDYSVSQFRLDKIYNIHSILKSLINDMGNLLIFFIGTLLVFDQKLEFSNLIVFNTLYVYFINPISHITDLNTNIKEAQNAMKRVNEVVIDKTDNGVIDKLVIGSIKYQNLTFSYDNINSVLQNINLNISAKDKVLILGDSGSGKSTLLKLLLKFYDIPRNKLFINNIDINDYKTEILNKNICYISQNEILFTDSLINNLKLDREIDNDKIEEMLDFCYIRDIFKNSNLGLNTLIEENGFNLSGGERQRIILARSLLKKFNLLIIDEGLNQVDISLERKILKNILKKYYDKTIIVISHRYDNMDLFNHVVKFKESKIIEDIQANA